MKDWFCNGWADQFFSLMALLIYNLEQNLSVFRFLEYLVHKLFCVFEAFYACLQIVIKYMNYSIKNAHNFSMAMKNSFMTCQIKLNSQIFDTFTHIWPSRKKVYGFILLRHCGHDNNKSCKYHFTKMLQFC